MNTFIHCDACPARGNCIVERTAHTPFCKWAASGNSAKIARVIDLSNEVPLPEPSLATTIASAAGAASRVVSAAIQGKPIQASDELYQQRMAICRECPEYDSASIRCKKCTCYLQVKARLQSEAGQCPKGFW